MPPVETGRSKQRDASSRWGAEMVSGTVAGSAFLMVVISRIATAPFDVVKIRFQLQRVPLHHGDAKALGSGSTKPLYRGMWQAFRQLFAEEGMLVFWRGNWPAMLLYGSFMGIQFPCYSFLSRFDRPHTLYERKSHPSAARTLVSGMVAGGIATTVTYPLDLARTQLAAQGYPQVYRGLTDLMVTIWRTNGLRGWFRGLSPTLVQLVPSMGIMFWSYELFQRAFEAVVPEDGSASHLRHDTVEGAVCGGLAGVTAKVCVYPLDTMKRRLQAVGMRRAEYLGPALMYKGNWDCAYQILKHEGIIGFYRGTLPSIYKSGIATSVAFAVRELVRDCWASL